jgi:hypothetical protein
MDGRSGLCGAGRSGRFQSSRQSSDQGRSQEEIIPISTEQAASTSGAK